MRLTEVCCFLIGFLPTSFYILSSVYYQKQQENVARYHKTQRIKFSDPNYNDTFNESLQVKMFDNVKILCMVMTYPQNHQKKAIHVNKTWGSRCNKLVFMSAKLDLQLDTVVLPIDESRDALWNKTKLGFQYLHEHYLDDYDWFLKADDDNYVIMENLRYMLSQYNPNTALYFGNRFIVQGLEEGYMAGGGYILSKKALKKFVENIANGTKCRNDGSEDLELGRCLEHSAIFVDTRDDKHQQRFFPVGVVGHMQKNLSPEWYSCYQYYNVAQGNTSCCSDTSIAFHYVTPTEMYLLDYLIYKVHPFGLDDHSNEVLPKKLNLKDVIIASDVLSSSPNFLKHKNYHNLDPSEFVK